MSTPENIIRKPAMAGKFYPADPSQLRAMVQQFLDSADVQSEPDRARVIVAPHAGYPFSGPTAGYAYARVQGKEPNRVVLLGCSHHYKIETASVYDRGAFETPLGPSSIDEDFATRLAEALESESTTPHDPEHSLEVQLPFIQVLFGDVPIVPVLFGALNPAWHQRVGELLAQRLDPEDLVVVSTDLSHFYTEEQANTLDHHSLGILLNEDIDAYVRETEAGTCLMCGATAVVTGMAYALARRARDWSVLDYRTSYTASGDASRVVGYAAVTMEQAA